MGLDKFSLKKALPFYEQVYSSIKEMILTGVLAPGERIYEAQLAREFEVSRSPIREAVRALEKDGLLVTDSKSQISVYKPTIKDVEEIYQCRMALESLAARLAAGLAEESELKRLEAIMEDTKKAVDSGEDEKETLIRLNGSFHDTIMDMSRNHRLQKQLYDLRALAFYYRSMNAQGEGRLQEIYDQHHGIYSSISERNAEKAAILMAQHIANDLEHLKSIVG